MILDMGATNMMVGGPLAKDLVDMYGLQDGARILDVGSGKGFLLHD